MRREIITVRGQSYVSRLPKYWPPIPLTARRVCTPRLCWGGGGRWHSPDGEGVGGSIFWKTRETGLPSYSKESLYARMVTLVGHGAWWGTPSSRPSSAGSPASHSSRRQRSSPLPEVRFISENERFLAEELVFCWRKDLRLLPEMNSFLKDSRIRSSPLPEVRFVNKNEKWEILG